MSHLLVIDLPGGNDGDVLVAAKRLGHRVTLAGADPDHYRAQPGLAPLLAGLEGIIALPRDGADWPDRLSGQGFDAVLCLQDLRLVEAAHVARALGLRHVSPECAALCRDKAAVRWRLAAKGIEQAPFARVEPGDNGAQCLIAAVRQVGLPAIVKPIDGFGSQHVFGLRTPADCAVLERLADLVAAGPGDYGLGIRSSGALLVERLHEGPVWGCDVLRADGRHLLLGVNEKIMATPPAFAIMGGCFTANCGQFAALDEWLRRVLDAVGFDNGAAHVELVMTADGPHLVEINPRLVGARISRVLDAALGRPVYADVIALALDGALPERSGTAQHAATRWVVAPEQGVLKAIAWPAIANNPAVRLHTNANPGDPVRPALDNADRLAMVLTVGNHRADIEALAEDIVAESEVILETAEAARLRRLAVREKLQ